MSESRSSFAKHLAVFLIIETVFVLILFREIPETSLYTLIGLLHISYWAIVLLAGWMREYTTRIWHRFLCTYLPVVYHLGIHIYAGRAALEHHEGEHHDEHTIIWTIVGAVLLGGLIWAGEWYLHRTIHCETHHVSAHQHCKDDCEHEHTK